MAGGLGALQGDVLVGRRVGVIRDRTKTRFSDSRPHAVDEGQLPDRCDKRFVVHQLLHFFQDRRATLVVELRGLLRSQCVDVGIAAVDIGPAFDDEGVEAGGGIAERTAAALNEVLKKPCRPSP